MALIPCPACHHQISDAAVSCPQCGHPMRAQSSSGTFKEALTRPEAVKGGITVLGLFVSLPWIARVLALILFVGLAALVILNK